MTTIISPRCSCVYWTGRCDNGWIVSCPATILIPTGSDLPLCYQLTERPVLELLLSVHWSLQITRDLAAFFLRGAYREMQKKMKALSETPWQDDPA